MDKWSASFNPTSLKGLSAPIWIRLPNLPLLCWDEINICRISSLVGKPLLIDGNLFQWGRREFGRVCVRLNLDTKLPMGIWVEGSMGKLFQKVEYERLPKFCYHCGRIGHNTNYCLEKHQNNETFGSDKTEENTKKFQDDSLYAEKVIAPNAEISGYGPWLQVNYGRKRNFKNVTGNSILRADKKNVLYKTTVGGNQPIRKAVEKIKTTNVEASGIHTEEVIQDSQSVKEVHPAINSGKDMNVTSSNYLVNKFSILEDLIEEGEITYSEVIENLVCENKESLSHIPKDNNVNNNDLKLVKEIKDGTSANIKRKGSK
ncbi:uncharacterized protein LOC110104904 [Dendrobium catenatum]|uniref:uncharacterized protein LOC110104904 n=1 Tax=Dendrobium catenatum TaxID=906689 RepID=UPI0009F639C0|nr:uncharacterized protein LOC110104904 [Dendrobium catenatum]